MAGNLEAAEMQEAAARIPKDVMLSLVNSAAAVLDVAREDVSDALRSRRETRATPLLRLAVPSRRKANSPTTSRPTGYCLRANTWALS